VRNTVLNVPSRTVGGVHAPAFREPGFSTALMQSGHPCARLDKTSHRLRRRSVVPNCVAKPKGEKRTYVCDEIHLIKDISSLNLRRPVDRGYVVNWDLQKEIWQGRALGLADVASRHRKQLNSRNYGSICV
jgi:hypothetical protein